MGPTGSGKSALALALAERFPVEIVSVDSAQVYRGMDIGTAKPDAATRARVPHHLIDILDPTEAYSAARFRADAIEAIAGIRARGAVPLLVGGTMLYFKALQEGLSALPAADPAVRARLDAGPRSKAGRRSTPSSRASIRRRPRGLKPTDAQRIQRALEVHAIAGRPLSELQGAREAGGGAGPDDRDRAHAGGSRARCIAAIAERFDAMLEAGLVAELAALRARLCADARHAVDALRRLPAGVGVSRRRIDARDAARDGDRRDAPAREAPVHLASRDAGDGRSTRRCRPRR